MTCYRNYLWWLSGWPNIPHHPGLKRQGDAWAGLLLENDRASQQRMFWTDHRLGEGSSGKSHKGQKLPCVRGWRAGWRLPQRDFQIIGRGVGWGTVQTMVSQRLGLQKCWVLVGSPPDSWGKHGLNGLPWEKGKKEKNYLFFSNLKSNLFFFCTLLE